MYIHAKHNMNYNTTNDIRTISIYSLCIQDKDYETCFFLAVKAAATLVTWRL